MSDTIDRRVVEMRFDNQQFESRTRSTLGLLEKLRDALNFSHASDGLDKLNKSVGNMNMSSLRSAVEGVQVSFSKLEAMAMTALVNITNRAVDAGIALAKNLTIDQLSAGWEKYADKTSAVQTIMAATAEQFTDTAEQMEFVNAQLDRLNWFTDETSYNFVDMVGNIGKFTANGVALDDAATAMQGIATWAAVSGGNASTASRAMYQLSQAMGMGAVKLQDWMSIETANMATYEFKEMALETAVSLGILEKQAEGTYKSIETGNEITVKGFRESLKEGWFSSDVLVKVLNQYGGFTNKLYEISEATGESATDLLQWIERYRDAGTNTSEVIRSMANETGLSVQDLQEYMNELTDDMYELGEKAFRAAQEAKTFGEAIDATKDAVSTGWMQTFEIIFGDYEEARVRWTALANELWDIFASGAEARNELLEEALGLPEGIVRKQTTGWGQVEQAVEDAGIPLAKFIHMCLVLGGKEGQGLEAIEAFKNSLSEGWLTGDIVNQAMQRLGVPIQTAAEAAESAGHSFEDFQRIISEVLEGGHGWGNGEERFRKFTEAGWDFNKLQDAVNKAYYGGIPTLEDYEAALGRASDEELRSIGYTDEEIKKLREVKAEYTEFNGVIGDTADGYGDLRSGSELLFDGISKGWNAIKGIFSAMKQGWDIAFPPITAQRLYDILAAFNSVANRFNDWVGNWDSSEGTPISETVENIRDTFAGLGSSIGLGLDILKETAKFLRDTFGSSITDAVNKILDFTAKVGRFITNLRSWVKENNIVRKGLEYLQAKIESAAAAFKEWWTSFKQLPTVQGILKSLRTGFSSFTGVIEKTFPSATKRLSELWNMIKMSFKLEGGFSGVIARIRAFGEALREDIVAIWESIKKSNLFGSFATGLESVWTAIKTLDPMALTNWAKSTWDGVTKFFQPVMVFFSGVKDKLFGYAEGINNGFRSIGDVVEDAASYLRDHFGSIIAALAFFVAARSVYNFIQTIIGIAKAITAPVTTIVNAFNGFADAARGIKRAASALAVVEVVAAIIGLAWTAVAIGHVPEEQLNKGVGVIVTLGIVVGAIIGVMAALTNAKSSLKPEQIRAEAVGMLKIVELAAAIMFVALAFQDILKAVDGKTWKQIVPVIAGMVVAIGALAGISWAISKYGGTGGKGVAGPMLAIAADVYILSKCFRDILTAITQEGVTNGDIGWALGIISAMTLLLGGIATALALVSKIPTSGSLLKSGGGIFAVALAVKLLVSAFAEIMGMTITWDAGKTGVIVGIIGAIAAIMIALSKMPASSGFNGVGILAVAGAVEILAIAIRTMASLDAGDIAKGVIAIGAMIGFLTLFTVLTSHGSKLTGKSALVFLGLSTAILIMAGAIALMSLLNEEDVLIGTVAITAMITAVGVMMLLSTFAKDLKITTFIGLAAIIAVLTGAVVALSFLDENAVLMGCLAITAMLTACGIMMLLMAAAKGIKLAPFAGLIAVIAAITIAILSLSALDPGAVLTAVAALTATMGVFTVMATILSFATRVMSKDMAAAIACLAMMTLVLVAIAAVIGFLANSIEDPSVALDLSLALSALFFSLSRVFSAVAALGKVSGENGGGTSLIQGLVGMIAIIGVIGALCLAIGGLIPEETLQSMQNTMEKAFPLLRTIGESIGQILGGLLEGIFTIDIAGLIQQLTLFAQGMRVFSAAFTGISFDEGTSGAIKAIGSTLLYLAGADLLNSITKLFGGDTSSLTTAFEGLPEFGSMLAEFGSNLQGADMSSISAAATAAKDLTKMVNSLPTSGGWKAKILGDRESLSQFGSNIVTFADKLKEFSEKISGNAVNTTAISSVAEASSGLVDLVKNLPTKGGWKGKILGDKQTLGQFGSSLSQFGRGITGFCNSLQGRTDFSMIQNAADGAGYLVDLAGKLPDEDGWLDNLFGGSTSLDEFGGQLETFGTALSGFCSAMEGAGDFSIISTVTTKVEELIGLAQNEGLDDLDNLKDAGDDIKTFGQKIKTFYTDNISKVDLPTITSLVTQIQDLYSAFSDVSTLDASGITSFGNSLSSLATTGITSFTDAFNSAGPQVIPAMLNFLTTATTALSSSVSMFTTPGTEAATEYINAFSEGSGRAQTVGKTLVAFLISALELAGSSIGEQGRTAVNNYIKEFQNAYGSAKSAGAALASNAVVGLAQNAGSFSSQGASNAAAFVNAISGYASRAYSAGASLASNATAGLRNNVGNGRVYGNNFGSGFVAGIQGYGTASYNAAYSIGRWAVTGLQNAINSHSPSKETQKTGGYFGIGFVSEILKWVTRAGEAGTRLGEYAVDSLNKAIANIPTLLTEQMNVDPVIRPVVDLSSAEHSVQTLNGMFNKSIGVAAQVASVTGASVAATKPRLLGGDEGSVNGSSNTNAPMTIYNTFNITSNDPEEVANVVSRRIQKQVERKEAIWAQSSGTRSPLVRSPS